MRRLIVVLTTLFLLAACRGVPVPRVTPTVAPTSTPTPEETRIAEEPSPTAIVQLTNTPTVTPLATLTGTPLPDSPTPTTTATFTLIPTETDTPTATQTDDPTQTPTSTPSDTPTATNTFTPTATDTPTNTPTATQTDDPTQTPTFTETATHTPSWTPTPSTTFTPTETDTPTATFTLTNTPTATNTDEPTATASFTTTQTPLPSDTPTATATSTASATFTVTPSLTPIVFDTDTPVPTATPTNTLPPSFTPTITLTPTSTFPPTANPTQIAQLQLTQTAAVPPSWTPVPFASPTVTIGAVSLDATPTFITATPGGDDLGIINTPIPSTPEIDPNFQPTAPQPTVQPTLFVDPAIIPPTVQVIQPVITNNFSTTITSAFSFNGVSGGAFNFNGVPLPGNVVLLAVNPAFPESYARTDATGMLYLYPPGGAGEGTYTLSPYFDGFAVGSANENKNRLLDIAWSPNGLRLAFIVDPPGGTDTGNAGVWFWQAGAASYQIVRDCVEGYSTCNIVNPQNTGQWRSLKLEWAPDSNSVLVTFDLPDRGRQGIAVVAAITDEDIGRTGPFIQFYDYGYWAPDGRIVVSGRFPDGGVRIGKMNADGSGLEILFDASASGLWMQDAVQAPDGTIYALGRVGDPNGPMNLYRISGGQATVIGGPFGDGAPQHVEWFPNRGGVVVTVNGRQYQALVSNPAVAEVNPAAGQIQVQQGPVPNSSVSSTVPDGVVEGSQYAPGQQLTVTASVINMRTQPSTVTGQVIDQVNFGEYVAILAGPYQGEGYVWWRVLNVRGNTGWIAAEQDGASLLQP